MALGPAARSRVTRNYLLNVHTCFVRKYTSMYVRLRGISAFNRMPLQHMGPFIISTRRHRQSVILKFNSRVGVFLNNSGRIIWRFNRERPRNVGKIVRFRKTFSKTQWNASFRPRQHFLIFYVLIRKLSISRTSARYDDACWCTKRYRPRWALPAPRGTLARSPSCR